MKSLLLTAKIAGVFLLVMGSFVIVTLQLFVRMVMRPLAHGEMTGSEAHHGFVLTVLIVGGVAMLLMLAIAFYITGPIRRMSRSMDRIAAGDLEHRIPVRGRDEAAVMGRSFNTMVERVRGMIVGQKELMAGVSHELRSPLTRMKISLELMRQGKQGSDGIEELEADVDELDDMVEELLLASRFDLGRVPLSVETLELPELCHGAWNRVSAAAAAQGTELDLSLDDDARRIDADRGLVVRLLGNLFENSVRYAGGGRIRVSAQRREGRIEIVVSDEGPGVDEVDLERLFEPFFRADRSRSRKTGAGGLGLMIVRRAVEAHGGSVRAVNGQPRGLAVTFDLAAADEHSSPEQRLRAAK